MEIVKENGDEVFLREAGTDLGCGAFLDHMPAFTGGYCGKGRNDWLYKFSVN